MPRAVIKATIASPTDHSFHREAQAKEKQCVSVARASPRQHCKCMTRNMKRLYKKVYSGYPSHATLAEPRCMPLKPTKHYTTFTWIVIQKTKLCDNIQWCQWMTHLCERVIVEAELGSVRSQKIYLEIYLEIHESNKNYLAGSRCKSRGFILFF